MYIPATRLSPGGGLEPKPYQKSLMDRLRGQAEVRNWITSEFEDSSSELITVEQVSKWFNEGNMSVWSVLDEITLGCFYLENPIRVFCVKLLLHPGFDRFILLSIIGNALFIAADNPLNDGNSAMFNIAEFVFNSIFLAEFCIKLVAMGVIGSPAGYFLDHWNRLDFTVLLLGWLPSLLSVFGVASISNFSFIRAIRILKVLKTVNNVQGLKRLVKAVLDAIPRLISVGYLLSFIFLLFGIFGTQLYMGRLRQRCFPEDVQETYGNSYEISDDLCSMDRTSGVQCAKSEICQDHYPGTNRPNPNLNPYQNFDNTPNSFLSIFVLISLEGWSSIMYEVMDASGEASAAYFVILVFLGSYFVVNLLIAVIYQSYIDTVDEDVHISDNGFTPGVTTHRPSNIKKQLPPLVDLLADHGLIPQNCRVFFTKNKFYANLKQRVKSLADNTNFHWVVVLLIVLNIASLAVEANGAEGKAEAIANDINTTCTVLFVIELVVRIVAENITTFFRVGFNILDMAIVLVSVIELFTSTTASALSAFRTLRVFRTFKLLSRWESLQHLVYAVFKSGPGLGYFCIVLFLYIFVCAVAGMSLFAGRLNDNDFQYGTPRANYDTFFQAFVSTFQVVSGENWSDLLFRGMEYNPVIGGIYYVIVYGIGNMIVLNLFLAILLENFSEGRYREDRISYYEQLDQQRDVQVVLSTVTGAFFKIIKHKVWVAFGYMFIQNLLPASWSGNKTTKEERGDRNDSMSSDGGELFDDDFDSDNERGDESVIARSVQFVLGRKSSSRKSISRVRTLPTHPASVCTGRKLNYIQSKWGGWDDDMKHANEEGNIFLQEDAYRRAVLGDIVCGQYRRGNQYFNDCFMAVEVVDILLDRKVVDSVAQAVAMGQELVFRRILLPVCVMRHDMEKDDDPFHDDDGSSVVTPYSNNSSSTPPNSMKHSCRVRKISADRDIRFCDDRSLYRLGDQGEQISEWLLSSKEAQKKRKKARESERLNELNAMLEDVSFGLFYGDSPVRRFCALIVIHKYTEILVMCMIVTSSLFLALDEPGVSSGSALGLTIRISDIFFTTFFALEMLVKMIAMGVYNTPQGYLKNGWNILDFVVVVISVLSLSLSSFDLTFLKSFRIFRALRPLRVVSRSPGMRAVVNAIILVIPPLINFVVVVSVFLLTFAILGTSMFRGRLYSCKATGSWDSSENSNYEDEFRYSLDMVNCTGHVTNSGGYDAQLEWKTATSNFDNIGNALLTLFELSTMEGWTDIMYPAMDIVENKTHHPVINNSRFYALYFISFIIVGSFFITNLFVGIIVHKFNRARMLDKGSVFLTEEQQKWLSDLKVAMSARPQNQAPVPSETDMCGLQRPIYFLVQNPRFVLVMDVVILLNIFLMTVIHYNQPALMTDVVYYLDVMFTLIFSVELLFRFLAVGFYHFSKNNWNRFDVLIVVCAILDVSGMSIIVNVTIFRVLRIGRILRLVKSSKNLIILLKTLIFSLPSLLNVGSLLFLTFFVFTITGMNIFGTAKRDGDLFTKYNNFEHFGSTMLLLFRCMTGENWNDIMHYLRNRGYYVAVPYFALFLITCRYMMLNLFIAVILENFEAALAADPNKVQQKNLQDFIEIWAQIHDELSVEDKDRLPCYALVKLIHTIPSPLGISNLPETNLALGDSRQRQLYRNFILSFIRSLDLKEDSRGRVYFVDVIAALVRRSQFKTKGANSITAMSNQQRQELLYCMRKMTRHKTIKKLETKMKDEVFTEIDLSVEFNSAMAIQAMWRGKQSREKLHSIISEVIQRSRKVKREENPTLRKISLRRILWDASANTTSSASSPEQGTTDINSTPRKFCRSNSTCTFFRSRTDKKLGCDRFKSIGKDEALSGHEVKTGGVVSERHEKRHEKSCSMTHIKLKKSSIKSMHSDVENSEMSRHSSWLAPLRPSFLFSPTFHREASQKSCISGITMSSWESSVDRKIHKQLSRESIGSANEAIVSSQEYVDLSTELTSARPFLFFHQDSRARWLPTEVSSTRTILGDEKYSKTGKSTTCSLPLLRSRTLSSLPTSLAQLTNMNYNHTLVNQNNFTTQPLAVRENSSTSSNISPGFVGVRPSSNKIVRHLSAPHLSHVAVGVTTDKPLVTVGTGIRRAQSWPLLGESSSLGLWSDTVECVESSPSVYSFHNSQIDKSTVAFVVFASTDIWSYAAPALLLNTHYAEMHGYKINFLSEDSASDFFPEDRRWNKIAAVLDAFDPQDGWARDAKLLVAMDADLIIMDSKFAIEAVADMHHSADLILSADTSDIGNTGFMIVRNTKWAYQFFRTWWEARYVFDCDQHAFNDLYTKLQSTQRSRKKIAVLPPGDINTEFPVYATYDDSSKILHLVGESNTIRDRVFQLAAANACSQDNGASVDTYRYGLSRSVIAGVAQDVLESRIIERREKCSMLAYEAPPAGSRSKATLQKRVEFVNRLNDCFQHLHEETSSLCSVGRDVVVGNIDICVDHFDQNYKLVERASKMSPPNERLYFSDHMTKNLHDSFLLSPDSPEAVEKGEKVISLLEIVLEALADRPTSDRRPVLYRQSTALGTIARMCRRLGMLDKALITSRRAMEKSLAIADVPPGSADYETYVRNRILSYSLMAEILSSRGEFREAYDMAAKSVDIAESLFRSGARENSQVGVLLIECYVQLLKLEKSSEKKPSLIERIRTVLNEIGYSMPQELHNILVQHETHIHRQSNEIEATLDGI